MGNLILVSYAGALEPEIQARLTHAQRVLCDSAKLAGIERVIAWDRARLTQTAFYDEHRDILDRSRGGGYWLWKPFIILDALRDAAGDDVVIYWDVGRTAPNRFTGPIVSLVAWCRNHGGLLPGVPILRQGRWTKRDCFYYMGCDEPRFWNAPQVQATFSMWSGGSATDFVAEWLRCCTDRRCITDDPNECGLENLSGFRDHRHDQSVLTNLCVKQGVVPLDRLPIPPGAWSKNLNLWARAYDHRTTYFVKPAEPSAARDNADVQRDLTAVMKLLAEGAWDRAELECRILLNDNPDHPKVLRALAEVCLLGGRAAEGFYLMRKSAAALAALPSRGKRPFLFVSIPRCASNTVHSLLGLNRPKDCSRLSDAAILDNHATCRTLLRRYGPVQFRARFKFSLVRNPWDRCVSWFFHHVKSAPYSRYATFGDWVRAGMPHHWDVQNESRYDEQHSPLEQLPFICDDRGRLMVDFVGQVEHFQPDLDLVARVIGIDLPHDDRHMNRAAARESSDYRTYYADETAELVAKRLERDITAFGYSF
jgi:hypothetical protein